MTQMKGFLNVLGIFLATFFCTAILVTAFLGISFLVISLFLSFTGQNP